MQVQRWPKTILSGQDREAIESAQKTVFCGAAFAQGSMKAFIRSGGAEHFSIWRERREHLLQMFAWKPSSAHHDADRLSQDLQILKGVTRDQEKISAFSDDNAAELGVFSKECRRVHGGRANCFIRCKTGCS